MAQDDATALQWLHDNPDDEHAPGVRETLRKKGYQLDDPPPSGVGGYIGDVGRTLTQGAILDPIQKLGQIGEKIPGVGPYVQSLGDKISSIPGVGEYLRKDEEAAKRHPWWRFAGNIAPWLLVPGAGESALVNAGIGMAAGATQPLDPKDPNYWRDLAYQTGIGGVTGGTLGAVAGKAAAQASQRAATEAAINTSNRWITETPERATMGIYQRIASEARDPSLLPSGISPQTAAQVQNKIGAKLNQIYGKMQFRPDAKWINSNLNIRDSIASRLVNPEARADWEQAFANEGIKPALLADPANPLGPITGEKLNQLVSNLGAEADAFGLKSQQGGGQIYRVMADGLRQIQKSVEQQIDAADIALGAQRRNLNRAYYLSDVMVRATSATKGGVASPTEIISAWQTKMGKKAYGSSNRFQSSKNLLQDERVRGDQPLEKLPPELEPTLSGPERAAHAAARVGAHALGIKAAESMGLPWYAGSGLVEAARAAGRTGRGKSVIGSTARTAGKTPGAPAAAAAQAAPKTADVGITIQDIVDQTGKSLMR